MGQKVVPLHEGIVPEGEIDPVLIEDIEKLLVQAKSGALKAFAYAAMRSNGEWGNGWCGPAGSRAELAAAISILAQRYTEHLRGKGD